jgi:exonuclease SbcD
MVKILHFADAHIDMVSYGRHDPQTGLPLRVLDFLKSLDTIIDNAIDEQVDLVLFAGDAYKDRNPAPTYQREWGRRIMRLSRAGIPTVLLVGNHDLSPALGRAHALDAFETLDVPHVLVVDQPVFLSSSQLWDLPLQIVAIPWLSRSGLMTHFEMPDVSPANVYENFEGLLQAQVEKWLQGSDPSMPTIFSAHCSVQGARLGAERSMLLGGDLVLSSKFVKNSLFDYVALGHIHHAQDLNQGAQPPVIYPGSIERVDFGEAGDEKYYVIAEIEKGHASISWRRLEGIRPMLDCYCKISAQDKVNEQIRAALPDKLDLVGAIFRLVLDYPHAWEAMIDEAAIMEYASQSFATHLVKRPQMDIRLRLAENQTIGSLGPLELLELYWKANDVEEVGDLKRLAQEILFDE